MAHLIVVSGVQALGAIVVARLVAGTTIAAVDASLQRADIDDLVTIERLAASGAGVRVTDGSLMADDPRLRDALIDGDRSDADLSAAYLAVGLNADGLVLATDVPAVAVDWATWRSRDIRHATPQHLRRLRFDESACGVDFHPHRVSVEAGGRWAAIGHRDDLDAVVAGDAGTRVLPAGPITYYARPHINGRCQRPHTFEPPSDPRVHPNYQEAMSHGHHTQ